MEIKISNVNYSYKQQEIKVLKNVDKSAVLPGVLQVIKKNNKLRKLDNPEYGYCYKYDGFPYIFEIIKYKKTNQKTRIAKLFGITVYSKTK